MRTDWRSDKAWSDRFTDEIKGILGRFLIGEIPVEDKTHNTDFMVFKMDAVRVACRIRRRDRNYGRYKKQFTIRSKRPSGAATEFNKMIRGWGDYLLYGFADNDGDRLFSWFIGDLSEFREWFNKELYRLALSDEPDKVFPWEVMENKPGSDGKKGSSFMVFDLEKMPGAFICGASDEFNAGWSKGRTWGSYPLNGSSSLSPATSEIRGEYVD